MSFESFGFFSDLDKNNKSFIRWHTYVRTYGLRCDLQDEAEEISANLPLLVSKWLRELSIKIDWECVSKARRNLIACKTRKGILCLWIRASLIYIDNCPTRCNTKQSIYYYASSLYMFRMSTTPIIRSTQNCNYSLRYCSATSIQRGHGKLAWPRWREVAAQKIWPVPEAVITVLCTPDDGCGWHPKHVQWTCRIINRLLYVASRWTIINTETNISDICICNIFLEVIQRF